MARLQEQIDFLMEVDKLKEVHRRTWLCSGVRLENSAEHSWHVSLAFLLLHEYAPPGIDLMRTLQLLLVHDIIEIDAGDTFLYDSKGNADKPMREEMAAARIFGLLPEDQQAEWIELWREFEERITPESRFARAIDRLLPLLHNHRTRGKAWQEHHISAEQVLSANALIKDASPELWAFARALIQDAKVKGYLT